jgi:hypothetical protein
MEVSPNVHCIAGAVVNCFLIFDTDGLTLIDTGIPGQRNIVFFSAAFHGG